MTYGFLISMRLLIVLLFCGSGMTAMAEIYQWTDADGQVHFGDRPPSSGARTIDMPETSVTTAPTAEERLEQQRKLLHAFDEERRQARDAREQAQQDKAERQRNCLEARDNLRSYETSSAIYDLDAAGERVYMDNSQREAFMAERRKEVETYCGKP